MPTVPYAKALVSVNGGGLTSGGLTVASAATIQLSGESISQWQQARWEIYAYPSGWPTPAGWTLDGTTGIIYSTAFTPPLITLEAAATRWGKWLVRLIVNGGTKNGVPPSYDVAGNPVPSDVVDVATGWQVLSTSGLVEPGLFEGSQFGGVRSWVAAVQLALHTINASFGTLAGDVTGPIGSNAVVALTGSAGVVTLPVTTKISSSGASNPGDIITLGANSITIGNAANVSGITVRVGGNLTLQANTGANYINSIGGHLYNDSNLQHFRDSGGNEYFKFDFTSPSFQIDSLSGTFPTTGFIRTKAYGGAQAIWTGRNAGGNASIVSINNTSLNFGDFDITSGWTTNVFGYNTSIQSRTTNVNYSGGQVGSWQWAEFGTGRFNFFLDITASAAGNAKFRFGPTVTAFISHDQAASDVATNKLTISAQAAFTGATGTNRNGADFELQTGGPDGAGSAGLFIIKSGPSVTRVSINDSGTWTFSAGSVLTSSTTMQLNATNSARLGSTTRGYLADHVSGGIYATFGSGGTEYFAIGSSGQDLLRMKTTDSGAGSIEFDLAKTSITIKQNDLTTNSGTGALTKIQAQNETGTTSIGGGLTAASGTGTTRYGDLTLDGPLVAGRTTQAMADANQTISVANSRKNHIVLTGANTANRTLTISRAPTDGAWVLIDNQCTGAFNVNVQFLTGTAFAVTNGKAGFVSADGTNAVGFTITK